MSANRTGTAARPKGRGGPGRWFAGLVEGSNMLGTVWILALMALINADVMLRAAVAAPVPGVPEMVSMSIVGIVFLQITHTLRSGRLTRTEIFLDWLGRRSPRARHAVMTVFALAGAAVVAAMFDASLPLLVKAFGRGDYVGEIGSFRAPTWPIRLIILFGCATLIVQFLADAWRHGRAALRGAGA